MTGSRYERTTDVRVLFDQGCAAGRERVKGLVILAFGKPAYNGHSYGTILFSNRFAPNAQITERDAGLRARLRPLRAEALGGDDHARARHLQLPPEHAEHAQGGP